MARRTQAERSDTTTSQLVAAAQLLFGREGYDAVSVDAVAAEAGVTKGAAYHHFQGKTGLFRAVFVREQERAVAAIWRAAGEEADSWSALRRGCRAFLEHCLDQRFRRTVLLDGPAVLGWESVRAIEYEHVLRALSEGMQAAAADGRITTENLDVRCRMIFGALCEAGMLLARSEDPPATLHIMTAEAERLLTATARPAP